MIDIKEIMKRIPHRYPFLLVDRILEVKEDSLKAIKNVTMNEPFFQGHFPDYPVMPGVLIVEAMAQATGILATEINDNLSEDSLCFFMSMDGVKFRRQVVPGDQLIFDIKVIKNRRNIVKSKCEAYVDGELACEAELTAMMTSPE